MIEKKIKDLLEKDTYDAPIFGIGCDCGDSINNLIGDYEEYFLQYSYDLEKSCKPLLSVGNNDSDYLIMMKYKIDHKTHMHNLFEYKQFRERHL